MYLYCIIPVMFNKLNTTIMKKLMLLVLTIKVTCKAEDR